jgi:type II secretory pathway predicted ATPase ExeA
MYLAHFKLHEKPFQLNTDPRFLWLGQDHKEALATLRYGVLENKGLLLLTGEIGTGKTTLVSALVDQLGDESVVVAQLPDPGLTRKEFFYLVSRKFGIDRPVRDKETFTDTLGEFLDDICTHNKKALLIVDEAQIMNSRVLQEVRLLSNMEYRHTKPLNIFLVGQTEFNQKLLQPENRAIKERIAVNYNLKPLVEPETAAYIAYRLQVAGAKKKIFTDDAIREIQSFSKGSPRQINILCDLALVRGYAENAKILDNRMIIECEERIVVHDASEEPSREAHRPPGGTSRPEVFRVGAKDIVQPRTNPAGHVKRYGILALVILLPSIFIFYMLWDSGLIKKYAPALDKMLSIRLQTAHDRAPDSMSTSPPRDLNDGRTSSATDGTPAFPPERDPTPAATTRPTPSAPQPVIDTAKKTVANLATSPVPAPDNQAGVIIVPQPPPVTSEPQKEKPDLSPLQREPDRKGEPDGMMEAAGRNEGDHPVEKLPGPAKPSDAPQLTPQDMGKNEIVTIENPPADIRKNDAVPPATDPESEKSVLSRPSIDSVDPANIIDWLLKEKSNADKVNKMPDSEPKLSLETAAQSRGGSDQIEAKEPSSDQINRAVAEIAPGQSTASPPKREEGTAASKNTTDDKVRVTEEKTSNNVPNGIRVIAEKPSEEQTVEVRLEVRLRSFLQSYCMTYAAKDLEKFTYFFGPGALENGKPFESLLPKYQKSFDVAEGIQYRIELQQYTYDNQKGTVNIEGIFFLRWLPPDKKWRENSGKIFMNLKDDGRSFLVQNLDYYGNRSTN